MSTRKQNKAIQSFQQIWQLSKVNREKNIVQWFLRGLLVVGRQPNYSGAGFVLPTTVLLLLVASLTVAALLVRSSSRTNQVILQRQQQRITNAATPAIDRAKAKLELLFNDRNYPNGIPAEGKLSDIMLTADYTLNGETRIDISGDGVLDNAWTYTDTAGTTPNTVAYSIIMRTTTPAVGATPAVNFSTDNDDTKSRALVVRNGPFTPAQLNANCQVQNQGLENGWFQDNSSTSILRKNFQVNAVVLPTTNNLDTRPYSTLEFQQDRRVDRGNKWTVWFRNDLEIFPGPNFTLNGAISTQGSLFLGSPSFSSHLISSPSSCLYGIDGLKSSEININEQVVTIASPGSPLGTVDYRAQVVSGNLRDNTFLGSSTGSSSRVYQSPSFALQFADTNDSVLNAGLLPALIALDPLTVFTANISRSRKASDLGNLSMRDTTAWNSNTLAVGSKQRIFQQKAPSPYLDDTYRADNRYGPNVLEDGLPSGRLAGDTIQSTDPDYIKLTKETPPPLNLQDVGLDGYWERRARFEGLRVIVGQRLELGNLLGAPTPLAATGRPHEALQRRTLRDNTAAVQATAIYHHKNDQDFPIACLATTVHPGTPETLNRSATFEEVTFKNPIVIPGQPLTITLKNDFFTGRGTNGWEYDIPNITLDFNNPDSAMLKALRNLAVFAGDPAGAYPPKQETATSTYPTLTHPYAGLTTLGDFSNLRRALLTGIPYASLSVADQSYVHTAGCALGMLADNIKTLKDYKYNNPSYSLPLVVASGQENWNSVPDTADSPQLLDDLNVVLAAVLPVNTAPTGTEPVQALRAIKVLQASADSAVAGSADKAKKAKLTALARLIYLKEQVELDRRAALGYECDTAGVKFNLGGAAGLAKLCPPRNAAWGNPLGVTTPDVAAAYNKNDVRYSALYYIFPVINHAEERTADPHIITNVNPLATYPSLYQGTSILNPSPLYATVYDSLLDDRTLEQIRIKPRTIGTDWKLDTEVVTTPPATVAIAPNDQETELIKYVNNSGISSVYRVPFKDSALFNGREMMNVRVLNLDLELLRKTKPIDTIDDTWLPTGGLVFAFREDALREGGIARPELGTWANYVTAWNTPSPAAGDPISNPPDTGWRMKAATLTTPAAVPRDPPLHAGFPSLVPPVAPTGISPKPIDYYPDPERRPYGFRLKNGSNIARQGLASTTPFAGLSFISDNPVYIQGDFNLHQKTGGVLIEEFTDTLTPNWSNFYTRTVLDPDFAEDTDSWRPSEILADAVTIISNNFCDGSIEDGFLSTGTGNANVVPTARYGLYGCVGTNGPTSYMNQNRPNLATLNPTLWTREDPTDPFSPIRISENGAPFYNSPTVPYSGAYFNFTDDKPLPGAVPTRINTMLISGIVPSRAGQSFGGLHNFPRFLENWDAVNLWISGSFIQLNFSTSATGPFDQDAWESNLNPTLGSGAGEHIRYYRPPNRLWGYDVAQQYRPAGPVARRFTVPSPARSEFYKELSAEDAYIKRLRCAPLVVGGTAKVDPNATGCT